MSEDLGTCEKCQTEKAKHLMYKTFAESRDINAREPVAMCEDCARDAFESGEYESDENE